MPKSKDLMLYPLFSQKSKVSTASNVDSKNDSITDGDNDEYDIPLTSLLMRSKPKGPPTRKSHSRLSKQGKGKKRFAGPAIERDSASKDTSERKCKKQKNILRQSAILSQFSKNPTSITSNMVPNVTPKSTASFPKDGSVNKLECDEDGKRDARTTVKKCEEEGFSPKTSRNAICENVVDQRRTGRLYSDIAMDFVAPFQRQLELNQYHVPKITNIVHKLNRRIANGCCLLQHRQNRHFSSFSKARIIQNKRSSIPSSYCWPKKWRIPSWISLEQPPIGSGSTVSRNIDHMAWDPMGVLLAVAIDRTIIIYDWDMLRAADLQGRNDRVRNCQESEFKIPPILKFRLPHPVASLVWNPFEIDKLAVGFRVSGEMIIYNVNQVARWLSKDPSRNYQRFPPQSTYKRIFLKRVTGSVSTIIFLDIQNVLVSMGRILCRWKLSLLNANKEKQLQFKQQQGSMTGDTLIWRYQSPSPVTSMAPVGSNIVVIGTNHGHLSLIDWTKRTKVALSFCHEHRPEVLQTWIPHDHLKEANDDKNLRNRMGVMKIKVQSSNQECIVGKKHWGRCRLMWVTQSGWLLSMILDSVRIQDDYTVHHTSPKVVFKNAEGSLIDTVRKSWSLPHNTIGIDSSNHVPICFVGVPTVTKILSHHDKFVLDSQPDTIVSNEMVLVVHGINDEIQTIPFPGVVKHLPQALAVHPSHEWIVVGERRRLHIMLSSGRAKI